MFLAVYTTEHFTRGLIYSRTMFWCGKCLVTEEELPYWHLEHEVLLAEAKANVRNSAVEEAGGSEHQDQVEVPRKGSLEEGKDVDCRINDVAYGGWFGLKQKFWI